MRRRAVRKQANKTHKQGRHYLLGSVLFQVSPPLCSFFSRFFFSLTRSFLWHVIMVRVLVVLVAALACACACAAAPARVLSDIPGLGGSYMTEALMELPYAGITEPIRLYYDKDGNRSRTEYYHGAMEMDTRPPA